MTAEVWMQPFVSHRTAHELGRLLADFGASPSPARLPSIVWAAVRG